MDMARGQREAVSPGSHDRPRPRSRGISFLSDKSKTSEGGTKYHESPQEKAKRDSLWKGGSKANPNAAVTETQPAEANIYEKSTLSSLNDIQHKDMYGNPIADPDRSNPTRPRMERPLDTIRSFEKAIDEGYSRRHSYMRQDAESWDSKNQYASRRSSYFGGNENSSMGNRYGMQQGGSGYYGGQNGQNGYNGPPRAARYGGNRFQSDPQQYAQQRPYQQHGYHQSYDTVNTGYTNGSDSTGQWANSTDPSSENSSIDRMPNKPGTPGYDSYGQNGYHGPIMEEQNPNSHGEYPEQNGYGRYNGYGIQPNGYGVEQNDYAQQDGYGQPNGHGMNSGYGRSNGAVQPPPPTVANGGGRRPVPLNSNGSSNGYDIRNPGPPPASRTQPEEKRKSWIKRRFSKS